MNWPEFPLFGGVKSLVSRVVFPTKPPVGTIHIQPSKESRLTPAEEEFYQSHKLLAEKIMGWDVSQKPYAVLPCGDWVTLVPDFSMWEPDGQEILKALLAKGWHVDLYTAPHRTIARAALPGGPGEKVKDLADAEGDTLDQAVFRLATKIARKM